MHALIPELGFNVTVVSAIVGGQTLRAVSQTHQIPEAAAIIVIAVLTVLFALFGYRWVHLYERYSWIPVAIIFFVVLGLSAKYMDAGEFAGSGEIEAASVLSFAASIVGFGIGWSSLAAGKFAHVLFPFAELNLSFRLYRELAGGCFRQEGLFPHLPGT